MHLRLTSTALLLVLGTLGPGCSSDSNNVQTCPANGLGVNASTGESCSDVLVKSPSSAAAQDCLAQFSDFKNYDCANAQIGVDKTLRPLTIGVDPLSPSVAVYWTITNCASATHGKKLNIRAIAIAGDSDCFFSAQPDIESKVIDPGQQIAMQVLFKPLKVGENQAAIYLVSDAENFPKMILPVCVKVLDKPLAGDGGAGSPDGGTVSFECKDVSKTCNEACHPGCSAVIAM